MPVTTFKTPEKQAEIQAMIGEVEVYLAELPPYPSMMTFSGEELDQKRAEHKSAVKRMVAQLEGLGARIDDSWDGAAVKIAGVRSTSTSGVEGALHNWITAAKKRLP